MPKLHSRIVAICALICIPLMGQGAAADDMIAPTPRQDNPAGDNGGFIVSLPKVDRQKLIDRIKERRGRLKRHMDKLSHVANRKMTAKDGLIAAIMPGGLIYAALKKNQTQQAKSKVTAISLERDELAQDLLVFEGNVTVAAADAP